MRGGPGVSALTGRNVWSAGPATHTAAGGGSQEEWAREAPHRSSGEKQAARAGWGPAGRCCPSVRTAGLVGWTPRPVPVSTRPPRGAEQDGEQAGLRARGGGEDRPGPRSPRSQLHPVLPPHPGEGGAASGPRGIRRAGVGGPAAAREPCPQCCPFHGSSGPSYKLSPPHPSRPTATWSPRPWPQSQACPELSSGTEEDPLPEPPWPTSSRGCQVSHPCSLPPSRSAPPPVVNCEPEEEANTQATLSTGAHAGHLSSPVCHSHTPTRTPPSHTCTLHTHTHPADRRCPTG